MSCAEVQQQEKFGDWCNVAYYKKFYICKTKVTTVWFILGIKRHKSLLPEVGLGLRDPTLDLAKHEADLALMERIIEIRKAKETTDVPDQPSIVAPIR